MDLLRRNLDDEQYRIARIDEGNLLVLAGPGSGKTRLLTNTAAFNLRQTPDEVWRVCCLTFTVEAARQLRKQLSGPALGAVPTRRVWVGNFHQFSQMLLGAYGHLLGWPRTAGIITPTETVVLLGEIVSEYGVPNVNVASLKNAISATKGRRETQDGFDQRSESFIRLSTAYQDRLRKMELRDFDDLLLDAVRLLNHHPGVQRIVHDTFRYVFVDELQDTNQIQMDLLGALVHGGSVRVFGVADADQMIYAWRDARPENLAEFEERFNARVESIGGNYRCPPRIVKAATAIIGRNPERQRSAQDLRSLVTNVEGELWEATAPNGVAEYKLICDVIERCMLDTVNPAEIAVLAPHRFKFHQLCPVLEERCIPFVHVGSDDLELCPLIRLFRVCLLGLANPTQPLKLASWVERANQELGRIHITEVDVATAISAASQSPPERLFTTLFHGLNLAAVVDELAPRILERIERLRRMLLLASADASGEDGVQMSSRVILEWHRLEATVLRSEQAVKLMTTFNAKGLEFHTVILPFCTKRLLPYVRSGHNLSAKQLYEARRNFYVGMTRSTHTLVFTRDESESRSVFLDEIPADLLRPWS